MLHDHGDTASQGVAKSRGKSSWWNKVKHANDKQKKRASPEAPAKGDGNLRKFFTKGDLVKQEGEAANESCASVSEPASAPRTPVNVASQQVVRTPEAYGKVGHACSTQSFESGWGNGGGGCASDSAIDLEKIVNTFCGNEQETFDRLCSIAQLQAKAKCDEDKADQPDDESQYEKDNVSESAKQRLGSFQRRDGVGHLPFAEEPSWLRLVQSRRHRHAAQG